MKKIYTLMSALALTMAMNAQQLAHMPKPELVKENTQSVVYTGELSAEGFAANAVPVKTAAAAIDTTLEGQYFIEGQMYMSYKPGYVSGNCFLITPFKDTTYYYSVYGPGKWEYETLNEEETDYETITVENMATLYYPSTSFGWSYCNPTLSVYPREIKTTTGTTYNVTFTDYMYGYAAESYWPGEIAPTNMMNGYWQPQQLTNCEMMNADRSGNKDNAGNRYMVSSGAAGTPWCFGTGMEIDTWGAGLLDTLINIIPLTEGASMWCDTVFVHCYNREAEKIEDIFPATTNLKLEIYPIEIGIDPETGETVQYLRHDSLIAQAVATQDNCVKDGGGYSIQFVFKEKNPFGVIDVKPAVMGTRCYAELTGFNASKCNFGIYCDYWETPTGGRTIWKKNGKFHSYGDMNIDMAFNAYFTNMHMFDGTKIMEVGEDGGLVQMGWLDEESGEWETTDTLVFACNISTNFEDDADLYYDEEIEDWITDYEVISGPYTYEEGGEEYISLTCEVKLELEPNEGYDRDFTVDLIAYAAKMPIKIHQKGALGPKPTALPVVKALNDNKLYNIMGVEVDHNYKGVVIFNGQKRLQ